MSGHEVGCHCSVCAELKKRVQTLEEWVRAHAPHCIDGKYFSREPYNHPSGTWYLRVCPCGAKLLTGGTE